MFTHEIKRARSKRPYYIALGFLVLVVAIVLLVPMPFTVKSTFELLPVTTVDVTAPRDGTIAELEVAPGAVVAKGSIIAKYDLTQAEQQVPVLEKEVERLEKLPDAKPNPKAQAAVTKAEAALAAAEAALEKAPAKGKQQAEARKEQAAAALEKARAAVGLSKEEREQQLTTAKAALQAARAQVASPHVYAPASGVLTVPGLEKGKPVTKDAKVGVVEDTSKLKAIVKVPAGEKVTKGQGVELVLPQGKYRVLFGADAQGDVAEAMFDNAKGELSSGLKGEANIEGTQRSIVSR